MNNELIKITTNEEGKKLVSARELYFGLGLNKAHWSRWSKANILNNMIFKEDMHWVKVEVDICGNKTFDFFITESFAVHIINGAKTCGSQAKIQMIEELNLNNKVDIISKPEIEFGEMLERFLKRWNVTIERQYPILNYRIDFLINGYIAIEYDEEHHDYRIDEDNLRIETINEYIKERFYGCHSIEWVRVKKGEEVEGLSEIIERLVEGESLEVWNNKVRFNHCNSETFGYLNNK